MSTGAVRAAGRSPRTQVGAFVGTSTLTRFTLRLDRVRILVWALVLGVLPASFLPALEDLMPTQEDRQLRAELIRGPAAVVMSGPGYGLDDYTYGAMVANEIGLLAVVAAAIMSILLVVRHTRTEEETGRAELVRANVVGRRAGLTSALISAVVANLAVGLLLTVGLTAGGLGAVDSLAFGAGVAAVGLVFAGVAALTAQLSEHARASTGLAMAFLGVSFALRAVGDVTELESGSPLTWLSPLGWAQATRVFVDLRWWPLALCLGLAVLTTALAFLLLGRRDVGAGLVRPRPGRAAGHPLLAGPFALTFRLHRAGLTAWGVAVLLAGLAFGALTDSVAEALVDNELLARTVMAGGGDDLVDGFLAAMLGYLAMAVGAYAVSSVLRLRAEETSGRLEPLLAAPVSRWRWLGAGLAVSALNCVVLLALAGLGTGVSSAVVTGDDGLVPALLGAALAFLPAVLLIAGVAALLLGLAPKALGLAWLVVAYALLVGLLGPLLNLPAAAADLSPFSHVPALPAVELALAPLVWLTGLALVSLLAGMAGFRRRDVPA
ncbi:ABC transporter permease [Actinoalloteichus caeruleus]|uniref:ABC-2 type transport system permease protein n=1 Tax=Actinoalloteichus caeruleus DSM 43889 TaxID=1120930 RepID=A0ABT1JMP8_ACTCY|nr:ABC transporter permease [Actinoalloteichus caeruleus]MCP2333529.1 ABC-2 type transport system permease protein [Actinoalloteichus caeruleus DSM 43889]